METRKNPCRVCHIFLCQKCSKMPKKFRLKLGSKNISEDKNISLDKYIGQNIMKIYNLAKIMKSPKGSTLHILSISTSYFQ